VSGWVGSGEDGAVEADFELPAPSPMLKIDKGDGLIGSGEPPLGPGSLCAAFEIEAFSMWASVGFIPQARHGGRGVLSFAVVGSKLEGTGFERLHIVHTQVAVVTGWRSGGGGRGLLAAAGDALPAWEAGDPRLCATDRFGFGMRVIFAEDFRKPD